MSFLPFFVSLNLYFHADVIFKFMIQYLCMSLWFELLLVSKKICFLQKYMYYLRHFYNTRRRELLFFWTRRRRHITSQRKALDSSPTRNPNVKFVVAKVELAKKSQNVEKNIDFANYGFTDFSIYQVRYFFLFVLCLKPFFKTTALEAFLNLPF